MIFLIAVAIAATSAGIVSASMPSTPIGRWIPKVAALARQLPGIPLKFGAQGQSPKMPGAQSKPGMPEQGAPEETVSLLVKTVPGLSDEAADTLVTRAGAAKKRQMRRLRLQSLRVPARALESVMKRLQEDPSVERVEIDRPRRLAARIDAPSDPAHSDQWALETTGWNAAWQFVSSLGSAKIAVLDTGVSPAGDELVVGDGWSAFGTDPKVDPNGHGTWVASIAAAVGDNNKGIAGVAFRNTTVLPVQVLDANGEGQDSDIIAGVEWAVANGADVILMAFSNPGYSQSLQDAIDLAWQHNIVIVAATGNEASDGPTFPAGDSKVVGVSATDASDALWASSNFGKTAFMAAPGVGISVVGPDGTVLSTSGTSASAAMVAGAAALLKIADPNANNGAIIGRLARNADVAGTQEQTGNGRLNIQRALEDTSYEEVVPLGAPPEGDGGPFVGPYRAAAVSTNTTIVSSLNPSPVGQSVTFTATIACTGNCSFDPTHLLQFKDGANANNCNGGTLLGSVSGANLTGTGNSRQATFTTSTLAAGSRSIMACFSGPTSGTNAGASNSAPLVQTVNNCSAPSISTHPSSQAVTYGASASFAAAASGAPTPTIQWQVSPGGGVWSDIPGETSATLTLTKPAVPLSGRQYRAQFTNSCGSQTATTSAATLTVAAKTVNGSITAESKTYDSTTAAAVSGRSLSGVISGDAVTLTGGTAAFGDKNVGTGKIVTLTGASLSGVDAANYSLSSVATTTANISPKGVTGSYTAANKEYNGNAVAALSAPAVNGKIGSDDVTLTGGIGAFADKNVGTSKTVTVSGASLTGADAGNYTLGSVSANNADITAKAVTGSYTAGNKEYDGNAVAALSAPTVNGKIGSDDVSLTGGTGAFADKHVGTGKSVTVSGASLTGADAGNYTLGSVSASNADITAKGVTGSYTTASKEYDGNAVASLSGPVVNGKIGSDDVNLTGGTGAFADKHVGTGKSVTVSGAALAGVDAGNYTLGTVSANNADITAKGVTGSYTVASKEYDGNAVAVLSAPVVNGKIGSDDVNLIGGTGAFSDKHVASGKTVTVTGANLAGVDAGNYTLGSVTANTADITAKAVTGAFTTQDKVYDAGINAIVLTRDVVGAISGDEVALSGGTAAFADKNVGVAKTVTLAGATLSGADAGNYNLTSVATETASITPVSLTPAVTVDSKIYDATTTAEIANRAFTIPGAIVPEELVALTGGTAAFADANVGTAKPVTITGLSLSGPDAGNYVLSSASTSATADISPKAASVSPDTATKVYGAVDPGLTGTMSGFVLGDGVTASYARAAGETVAGGPYAITATLAPAGALSNYAITYNTAVFTITARPVTVTAEAKSKTYGDADPALTYTGTLVNGDTFSGGLIRAAGENVGSYAIGQGTLTAGGNYAISFVGADLTITPRTVTVTAEAKSKTYGDADPALTYTGDLVNGDTFSGALIRTSGENVGSYAIGQGTLTAGGNYAISFIGADLTITARAVTVTAEAKSKTYGDADPALTYIGTLVNGDAFTGTLIRAAGENVGSYAIGQGTLTAGGNYAISFIGADLTITARSVTVTANSVTRVYGDSTPAFSLAIAAGSLATADTLNSLGSPVFTPEGIAVGSHRIAVTGLVNNNYSIAYTTGNDRGLLTITKRPVTATAAEKTKVYGDADPALTYDLTSGTLAYTDAFSGALSRAAGEGVAAYAISQGTLALSGNYDLTFVGANLTVTPRSIAISAAAKAKTYGEADPALTYQITSGSLAFSDMLTGVLTRAAGENVGSYAIQQGSVTLSSNYTLTYVGALLTISKRPITVTADAKSKQFGAADPSLTYQLTSGNLVNGNVITGALTRTAGEAVGSYPISQGTLTAGANYELNYAGANLTIGSWTAVGFYSPIAAASTIINGPTMVGAAVAPPSFNPTTIWNSAKGGSALPLKFDIFRNGLASPESTNINDVKGFVAVQLSACSAGTDDTIEDVNSTTLSTGLKYDGEQFHQNWKTPSVKTDTCFRVTVTLQDNTTIHTFVKLKK